MDIKEAIGVARGEKPVDLLIENAQLINTLSGEIHPADIAVYQDTIVGLGQYEAKEKIDVKNRYVCPGLIEGHIHIESSLLNPIEFLNVVAKHGTSAVVCDPHELANVHGKQGIEYLLQVTQNCPVSLYIMVPSCVPATDLETSGGEITVEDINEILLEYPERALGLAEMMNYPGVIFRDEKVIRKLQIAKDYLIDGHCPGLGGKDLNAYILAGPSSEHEASLLDEAREKLRKGMYLMIREGSTAKNLKELVPLFKDTISSRISFVTDDRHADELDSVGHLDYTIREAIRQGLDPVRAVQATTIQTAEYFGLKGRGAIAPGYKADFIILNDLDSFDINIVYLNGEKLSSQSFGNQSTAKLPLSMNLPELKRDTLHIPYPDSGTCQAKAIQIVPGQIVTQKRLIHPLKKDSLAWPDPEQNQAKLAVIERHHQTGNIGLGFVSGLGLSCGAIASTVAHDSHNLILAGIEDQDMILAARVVNEMKGGFTVIRNGTTLAKLPLSLGGLMSKADVQEVSSELTMINKAVLELGCPEELNVFMILSFLALPVIPEIRLTDMGLVDVNQFTLTDLWE